MKSKKNGRQKAILEFVGRVSKTLVDYQKEFNDYSRTIEQKIFWLKKLAKKTDDLSVKINNRLTEETRFNKNGQNKATSELKNVYLKCRILIDNIDELIQQ